jgi:hypothetical protein
MNKRSTHKTVHTVMAALCAGLDERATTGSDAEHRGNPGSLRYPQADKPSVCCIARIPSTPLAVLSEHPYILPAYTVRNTVKLRLLGRHAGAGAG